MRAMLHVCRQSGQDGDQPGRPLPAGARPAAGARPVTAQRCCPGARALLGQGADYDETARLLARYPAPAPWAPESIFSGGGSFEDGVRGYGYGSLVGVWPGG